MKTLKEVRKRWSSESEPFFKKLTNTLVAVGAISGAILSLPLTLPVVLPALVVTVASYGIAVGTAGAIVSKLTNR